MEIDTVEDDAEETTTFAEVFRRALYVATDCVAEPPHLGGKTRLGPTQMLELGIIGSSKRKSR